MTSNPRLALFCAMAFSLAAGPVLAQAMSMAGPGMATQKVIAENEKLQVIDVVQPPGTVGAMASRTGLVVHWITGGTAERTYADGSKDVVVRKTGETAIITEKRPFSVKNVGKTITHLIEVKLK
jgi:hypothetical protein